LQTGMNLVGDISHENVRHACIMLSTAEWSQSFPANQ
jgi:hypothetical protein